MANPVRYQLGVGASAVGFNGYEVPLGLVRQSPPAWRSGFEVGRDTRDNVFPFVLDSLDGGFLQSSGFFTPREKTRVFYNEGIMVHLPKIACLPYKSTVQFSELVVDVSAYRAANKRVHAIMSSLGVDGMRFLAALGPEIYQDTSLTDPALVSFARATDNILSCANLKLNATDYTAFSSDGTTDDTFGYPSVATTSGVASLVTHAHADDGFFFMDLFPSLGGGGWNIFGGVLNQVNGLYCYPTNAVSLPLTATTMLPVVYKDTKDRKGTIATVTTADLDATRASSSGSTSGKLPDDTDSTHVWESVANVLSSNDSRALFNDDFDNGIETPYLFISGFDVSSIPDGAILTGCSLRLEARKGSDLTTVAVSDMHMFINGSPVGLSQAAGNLLTTSDANYDYGSSTNDWSTGGQVTGKDLKSVAFGVKFAAVYDGDGGNVAIEIDYFGKVAFTYQMPGTLMALPKGGWSPGKPSHRANRLAGIHPLTDEEATTHKPRIVTFIDLEHDPEGNRLVGTTSQPPTQMPTVTDAEWFQGGLAIAGGNVNHLGLQVKLIDDDNVTRDLGFPAVHGTEPWRVTSMFARGAVLMCWTRNSNGADAQLWMYFNGRWHAFGALFSKAHGTMSDQAIPYAERTFNTQQNIIYNLFPAGANTGMTRQFVPLDPMNADPFLTNTSQEKQDGPLYVQTAEIEVLPSEANNAIMALQLQSRRVDNNTSYGSVNVKINVVGDHSFAASAVNETFDAAAECFVDRPVRTGAGDPGIAFKTVIHRLTLDHQTGTTETPNALPLIDFMVSDHVPLEKLEIHLVTKDGPVTQSEDPVSMAKRLRALMNTKVAQRFNGAGRDIPVKFKYDFVLKKGSMGVGGLRWEDLSSAVITLEQTPGTVTL